MNNENILKIPYNISKMLIQIDTFLQKIWIDLEFESS